MKSLKSIFLISMIVVLLGACVGDLDPKSLGPKAQTSQTVYKTTADYLSGLAKLYAAFALSGQQGPSGNPDIAGLDEGFGVYLREYWNHQELTTDEAVIAWNDQTVKNFHYQNWTPNDVFVAAMYSRAIITVSFCNEFIRASKAAAQTDGTIKQYYAEARFLRALAYWHALDLFGNPPFVTEDDAPGAFNPKQTNQAKLFDYIETELTAIENDLLTPSGVPGGPDYGHATKGALYMLQAKLYLNAETYIGAAKYSECIAALNKLFALNKYSLPSNYLLNFGANNNTSPELIFTINYDGNHTRSYGGMDYIIHACIGGSMSATGFGVSSGWGGTRVTSSLVGKFTNGSDTRAQFYTSGQNLVINDIGSFTDGYAVKKFTNRMVPDAPPTSGVTDFVDTDFPMFRLADANLMLAEAFVRGGSGTDATTATLKLNEVIRRANNGSLAYDRPALTPSNTSDLDFLLDERGRELFWECHRRTDLIRYGLFTGDTYLWPWKGNVATGAKTDSYRDLFPIPTTDLSANPNLVQNPGYPK